MNSLAVIRATNDSNLKIALHDLVRHGHLSLANVPKKLEPSFADNILVHVMKSPLKNRCMAAAVVPLMNSASAAIGRLRDIHPPAHVIIISPRYEIYYELINYIEKLPEAFQHNHPNQKKISWE